MSLLYKPLELITVTDLQSLVDNQVGENLYIEYKSEVFDKRDENKKIQFLGSLSGFANAAGGDLLIGVKADSGLPIELTGVDPADLDSEVLRITQVVGSGVEPQLTLQFQPIPLPTGRSVLIVRIPRSWRAPHGIEHKGHFQFFKRHAAGRSPMTLSDLRTAFTFPGTIAEQTRNFRRERLTAITATDGPWGYQDKPLMILHLVPFASAVEAVTIDFPGELHLRKLSPFAADSAGFIHEETSRYSLDGYMLGNGTDWHTLLFRNGTTEFATTRYFDASEKPHCLKAWDYQVALLRVLGRFLRVQRAAGMVPPATVLVSVLNAARFHLRTSQPGPGNALSKHSIDRDQVLLSEAILTDFNCDLTATLKPTFDCLWNAAGEPRCSFYRDDGKWKPDPSWLDPPNVY